MTHVIHPDVFVFQLGWRWVWFLQVFGGRFSPGNTKHQGLSHHRSFTSGSWSCQRVMLWLDNVRTIQCVCVLLGSNFQLKGGNNTLYTVNYNSICRCWLFLAFSAQSNQILLRYECWNEELSMCNRSYHSWSRRSLISNFRHVQNPKKTKWLILQS